MSENVWALWESHALNKADNDAVIHWIAGEMPVRWTFSGLLIKAKAFSVLLKQKGIKKQEVCALIIRHHPDFYPLYMGISLLGAIPSILAYPNPRLHPEKFRQGIEGMSQRSGLDWILTESELLPTLKPLIDKKESTIKGVYLPFEENIDEIHINEFTPLSINDDKTPFLLQHSSGTTGLQKPVLISHHALLYHAKSYGEALDVSNNDKVISWLPLYHDMGLIASFHLPLLWGIPSIQINPFDWIIAPELFIEATSKEKATMAWMPNFAFHLMANKIHDEDITGFSLSSLRLLVNSSEPIRKESFDCFTKKFTKYGFNPLAYSTLYGMAETTMAVTQSFFGCKPAQIEVDRQALAEGYVKISQNAKSTRVCISAGKLIQGCEIRILDENKNPIPQGMVGEIAIKSVSLFEGYRNYPEKTAEVMHNGWYLSGDIGFMMDDNYFIIGRKKDTIISAGKNIYPEDIEDVISLIKGIIPGRVIAFGEEDEEIGTELISVLAETKVEDEQQRKTLKQKIIEKAMTIDVSIHKVYLVPPRWLIKSSAGKPGRKTNKERILNNESKKWEV